MRKNPEVNLTKNETEIEKKTPELLSLYRSYNEKLSAINGDENQDDLPEIKYADNPYSKVRDNITAIREMRRLEECEEKGEYIHFTPDFVLGNKQNEFGPSGKNFG